MLKLWSGKMKNRKILIALFIASVFLWSGCGKVSAMNTGFLTDNMEIDEQQVFLSNINLSLVSEEPKKNTIICFDVNDDGLIVIGTENLSCKLVSVYTSDGTFKYGYTFNCSGNFGVEWDNDNIIIYFVRSDVAASFNAEGINVELKKIQDTSDNNYYWNHSVYSTQKTVNEIMYTMKNNMGLFNIFASSYSQLIKTDADGNITTIYDVSNVHTTTLVIILATVILFIVLIVSVFILRFIKLKNR